MSPEEERETKEFRVQVLTHIAKQETHREHDVQWQEQISARVGSIEKNGCFRSVVHEDAIAKVQGDVYVVSKRVKDIETLPRKSVGLGLLGVGGIASLVLGMLKGISMYFASKNGGPQ